MSPTLPSASLFYTHYFLSPPAFPASLESNFWGSERENSIMNTDSSLKLEQEANEINRRIGGREEKRLGNILCLKSGAPHGTSVHGGWLFLDQTWWLPGARRQQHSV